MNPADDLLHEAIEGRIVPGPAQQAAGELARLAGMARRLSLPGPGAEATARLATRFNELAEGRQRRGPVWWLLAWLGIGPHPRGLVQQLAAGALLVAGVTTSAGVAAGYSPLQTATGIVRFAGNAIANLGPHNGNDLLNGPQFPDSLAPAATPSPSPSPATPASTQGPATSPVPATPDAAGAPAGQDAPQAGGTPPPAPAAGTETPPPTPARTPTPPATATPTSPGATPGETPSPTPKAPSTPTPSATPSPTPTPTSTPQPSPSPSPQPDQVVSAGSAGTVTLRITGGNLHIVSIQPASGWVVTGQQESGPEVEIEFKNGTHKLSFKATLQGGQINVTTEQGDGGGQEGGL